MHIKPEDDPTSIGNILVKMGIIDKLKLQEVVREFNSNREEMLGEFICRRLNIPESMIELALAKQRVLRGDPSGISMALNIAHRGQMRVVKKVEKAAITACWVKANAK